MMRRTTVAVDRAVFAAVGLVLVAGGIVALAARQGAVSLGSWRAGLDQVRQAPSAGWFGVVLAGLAVVLVLVGLRWLVAHLPAPAGRAPLLGTATGGRLAVDLDGLADAAARDLASRPGVRRARARTVDERGGPVVAVVAVLEPEGSLPDVARAVDEVCAAVARAAGEGGPLPARVRLKVARRGEGVRGSPRRPRAAGGTDRRATR